MPIALSETKQIAYERYGDISHPAILMIQGLSMPSTAWPVELIDALVLAGYQVISFDNRDIGQSRIYNELKKPNLVWAIVKSKLGLRVESAYGLGDMADDAAELLDALDIEQAHIVGVSMGGMIGQHFASKYPNKALSFVQIMSTSGAKDIPGPTAEVSRHIAQGPKAYDRASVLAFNMKTQNLVGTMEHPLEGERLRQFVEDNLDRGQTSAGIVRQAHAIIADGDRSSLLSKIRCPTTVIHGDQDPLVKVEGGKDVASKILGARLAVINGMGHDLPPSLMPRIVEIFKEHLVLANGVDNE